MDWTVAFLLYLFTRLDAIKGLLVALSIMAGTGAAAVMLISFLEDVFETVKKPMVMFTTAAITFTFLAVATPTQKDMAIIVGGAISYEQASRLVNNERLQNLGDDTLKALELWVEEQTEEKRND